MYRAGGRTVINDADIRAAASRLAEKLRPFSPTCVLYIRCGGALLGRTVADVLNVEARGIDIRYPASRVRSPLARRMLFPFKEILYKLTRPSIRLAEDLKISPQDRIALIDDTASSGKTLCAALAYLTAAGIPRRAVRVAVFRRGPRAARFVDYFETPKKVVIVCKNQRNS